MVCGVAICVHRGPNPAFPFRPLRGWTISSPLQTPVLSRDSVLLRFHESPTTADSCPLLKVDISVTTRHPRAGMRCGCADGAKPSRLNPMSNHVVESNNPSPSAVFTAASSLTLSKSLRATTCIHRPIPTTST